MLSNSTCSLMTRLKPSLFGLLNALIAVDGKLVFCVAGGEREAAALHGAGRPDEEPPE